MTREIRVDQWRDGQREEQEERYLRSSVYSEDQLLDMMRSAGFTDVHAEHGYVGTAADSQEAVRVLIARRQPAASDS